MNKTEQYEFKNLQNLFETNPKLITSKYKEYTLFDNSAKPSEKKDFILNADSIFKSTTQPIIYVQNSSFENNFYIQKRISQDKGDFKSLRKTIMIGEKMQGKKLINSIVESFNKIFAKKSNYQDFPNNKDAFAYLYLTCDSLLKFNKKINNMKTLLEFTLKQYIEQNSIKNYYKKILVTFNPFQVKGHEFNIEKSHGEIDEQTWNIEIDLTNDSKVDKNDLIEQLAESVTMHEYFLI